MDIQKALLGAGTVVITMIFFGTAFSLFDSKISFDAEKWVENWVKIWNTYDLDQVDELFLQNERLTYFSSEKEGAIVGIDAI